MGFTHPTARGVLITRPEPDASETAALVATRGYEPVIAPVLVLQQRRVAIKARFDALVLTSRNAVPALPDWYRNLPVFAVGQATAARTRAAGFDTVFDADADAAALAVLIGRTLAPGSRLLFVHGLGQGDALNAALLDAGFSVQRRRGYAVQPARRFPPEASDALRSGRLRSAMFLSAATARAFVRLLPAGLAPLLSRVDAAAIGQPAADALAPLPFREVRVSLKPTLDEVLALI